MTRILVFVMTRAWCLFLFLKLFCFPRKILILNLTLLPFLLYSWLKQQKHQPLHRLDQQERSLLREHLQRQKPEEGTTTVLVSLMVTVVCTQINNNIQDNNRRQEVLHLYHSHQLLLPLFKPLLLSPFHGWLHPLPRRLQPLLPLNRVSLRHRPEAFTLHFF